jgi:phosphoribosylformylglycinamidine synthase
MAARVRGETIKPPGTLVILTYAPCSDIRVKVIPKLKASVTFKKSKCNFI